MEHSQNIQVETPRQANALMRLAPDEDQQRVLRTAANGDARSSTPLVGRAYPAVNAELVSLYWHDQYISRKVASAEWGDGVVEELASSLSRRFPGASGAPRDRTFFGCASSTRRTARTEKSQHC